MKKIDVCSRERGTQGSAPKGRSDGSQYLYLSKKYFELGALNGISIPARLLLKFLTIETFRRNHQGRFARTYLAPARFGDRSLYNWFEELNSAGYVERLHKSNTPGVGSLYRVSDVLIGTSKKGLNLACAPYRTRKHPLTGADVPAPLAFLTEYELFLFEFITLLAHEVKNLSLTLKVEDLVEQTGVSSGTIKRTRERLAKVGLLGLEGGPRPKLGNDYLLNPMLIWRPKREEYAHHQRAAAIFHSDQFCQYDAMHSDQFCGSFGSFWRVPPTPLGTNGTPHSDQFCRQSYSCIPSLIDGAPRYCTKKSAGGPPGGAEEGVLPDIIGNLEQEGVALPGDVVQQLSAIREARYKGKITADEAEEMIRQVEAFQAARTIGRTAKPKKKNREVGKGAKSNLRAET